MKTPSEHDPNNYSCLGAACCENCTHAVKNDELTMSCFYNPGYLMPHEHTCEHCKKTPYAKRRWKQFHDHHYYQPYKDRPSLPEGWYQIKSRNLFFYAAGQQVHMPVRIKPYKPYFDGLTPTWAKCEGLHRIKRIVKAAVFVAPADMHKIPYSIAVSMFGKRIADKIDAAWIQKPKDQQMELFTK